MYNKSGVAELVEINSLFKIRCVGSLIAFATPEASPKNTPYLLQIKTLLNLRVVSFFYVTPQASYSFML